MIKKETNKKKGFILVETIVAVALFSVIMTVALISLLSLVQANKRTQTFKIVVNNINLALENISKEIRVGSNIQCDQNGCSGKSSVSFTSRENKQVTYALSPEGSIQSRTDGGPWYDITAPDIVVKSLKFYVRGESHTDKLQPKVVIVVWGYSGERGMDKMKFELQTTVSQRTISD